MWNGEDCDEMPALVGEGRSDRQPVPLLKRANGTTETVRMQSIVGMVYEGRVRRTVLQASKAGARHARWAKLQVHVGEG